MKYQEQQNKQTGFQAMTGYTVEGFNRLLPYFTEAHREYLSEYHMNGKRRSGYQGYRPDGVKIVQPKKKPRGKELTKEEKENNRAISTDRVRVEHAIGSIKRCRILKDECRLRKNNFTAGIFALCTALHNFRLKATPFCYKNKLT